MIFEKTKSEGSSSPLLLLPPAAAIQLPESPSESFEVEDTRRDELIGNNQHACNLDSPTKLTNIERIVAIPQAPRA